MKSVVPKLPSLLPKDDRYFRGGLTRERAYNWLGAHPKQVQGEDGVLFVVWAPAAKRVAVVGSFNAWDGTAHLMNNHSKNGLWELFVPGVEQGALYNYEIQGAYDKLLPRKADPYAFAMQSAPKTASVVWRMDGYQWGDEAWMAERAKCNAVDAPVSIFEVHLGSWKRKGRQHKGYLTYRELAEELIPYVKELGFTHLELMPVSEYPFDGSWGYQPIGLFAPTSRFGTPDDFKYFIDRCHQAGLAVLIDWVAGHFPEDEYGLCRFDSTCLYEHKDPRKGFHPDWNTLIYDFGREEVITFLVNNALFWLDQYHIDGLRVDAVASMLYLDYSRKPDEWKPNKYGGNENLEAIEFLRDVNNRVQKEHPGTTVIAEESTAWPGVSRPTYTGGLGFDYKWNMGWMHDSLKYIARDPIHRQYHHDELTFGFSYAYSENFVLPLSHDEVVHGKGSLLGRMPGTGSQRYANLRAFFGFMWTHPGKKLLFMGGEFAQEKEWNHDSGLDWKLLRNVKHAGVSRLIMDLNHLYRSTPALYERDCAGGGFEWIVADDHMHSVYVFRRIAKSTAPAVIVACNFTPAPRDEYRIGVPELGEYQQLINTDATIYGGAGVTNSGKVLAEKIAIHGHSCSIAISLPPLATLVLQRVVSA